MLSFFRKGGAAQLIVGGVVFAIIIVFVLEFRAGRGPAASLKQDCAVEVLDHCVSVKDFYAAYGLIVPPGVTAKKVRTLGLRKLIANGLVERELLLGEAERLGISVSEKSTNDELASGRAHISLPAGEAGLWSYRLGLCVPNMAAQRCEPGTEMIRMLPVKNSKTSEFDYKKYERVVRNTTNRSPREFKEMQRKELIADRMRDLVRSRVRVPEGVAFAQYSRERSRDTVRTVDIKRSWFAKYLVDTSDKAVDKWAADNKAQVDAAWKAAKSGWKKDCPQVREIVIPFSADSTDDDKVILRGKIDAAKKMLDSGEPFAQVARENSQGPTAMIGGEIGCLTKRYGDDFQQLSDAVKSLEPGQRSPVIETPDGFHLVKLERRVPEGDLEKVGRRVIARRLQAKFAAEEMVKKFAADLTAKAKAGEKLEQATQELVKQYAADAKVKGGPKGKDKSPPALSADDRPKFAVSAPFNIGGNPLPDALPAVNPTAKAFDLDKPGDLVADPIPTRTGLAVMQLKEKDPAKRADFEKDKDRILAAMRSAKQADALARYVSQLRARAKDKIKVAPQLLEAPKGQDQD